MVTQQGLRFHHIVSTHQGQIATARDSRNKIQVYLISNADGAIYKRNGLKDSWDPLEESTQRSLKALLAKSNRIARYETKYAVL